MQTIKIGKHTASIFDGIEDMPIVRYHKFMKCLLIDAGIGGDMAAVDRHLYKARAYVGGKKIDLAQIELDNLRQNFNFILNGVSPRLLAFAALVAELDGKPTGTTDSELQKVADILKDATVGEVDANVDAKKKRLDDELKTYFADLFDDESDKEYYDLLKSRTLAMLQSISGEGDAAKIERLTQALLLHVKPKSFVGKDNAEIRYEKNFERLCLYLSEYTNKDVKSLTTMEFYNLYEYGKEQIKIKKKQLKKN
jgi:hypothetical protein